MLEGEEIVMQVWDFRGDMNPRAFSMTQGAKRFFWTGTDCSLNSCARFPLHFHFPLPMLQCALTTVTEQFLCMM
jgi:hypothetical protein